MLIIDHQIVYISSNFFALGFLTFAIFTVSTAGAHFVCSAGTQCTALLCSPSSLTIMFPNGHICCAYA